MLTAIYARKGHLLMRVWASFQSKFAVLVYLRDCLSGLEVRYFYLAVQSSSSSGLSHFYSSKILHDVISPVGCRSNKESQAA